MTDPAAAIHTRALRKIYGSAPRVSARDPSATPGASPRPGSGGAVVALDALDLEVRAGEFFGLLGPNGAGKTTTIGILTTRIRPTSGEAFVAGASVTSDPVGVRRRIGVVPQRPNPDRGLGVIENLVYHAAYFGIGRAAAERSARELLERFGLAARADARVDALSGGQQQRLMIARALIHRPHVLFLDEPTVGLDPQARLELWDILRDLHAQGRTIILTTHYMEEADRLCERVAIVDRGRLLALGSPAELKARAPGGTLIELAVDGDAVRVMEAARGAPGLYDCEVHDGVLRGRAERPAEVIPALLRATESAGGTVRDIRLVPPSLESLFISLTGRALE